MDRLKNSNIIIAILLLIIVVGGAFLAGMKYQQSRQPTFARQFGNGQPGNGIFLQKGGQGMMGGRAGLRPVTGSIISSDQDSITVKLPDGSSRIVLLTDKTEINKASQGTKDDLKVGEAVAAFGQENSDGTVTAQNIQLNPILRTNPTPTP